MDEGPSSQTSQATAGGETDAAQAVEGDQLSSVQQAGDVESMELESDQLEAQGDGQQAEAEGNMDVHLDAAGAEQAEDMIIEAGPSQTGKRVKVGFDIDFRRCVMV